MNPTLMRLGGMLLALSLWLLPDKINACGYAYISDCATQMDLEVNGSTATYRVSNCPYLNVFNNANFGSVNSLSVTKLRSQTWESCDNNVMNARFYYRIYLQSASPGAFTSMNLTQLSTVTNGAYRNKTRDEFPSLNLLAGLNPGNYFIEIYFQSDVDFDNNGTVNAMLTANNGGTNYKASFTVPSNQGGSLAIALVNKTNVACNGGNTGSASVNVTNGTAPFSFLWSGGQTTASVSGLAAGVYVVSATDAGGNSGTLNVSITQPPALLANLTGVDETSAPANNGSATAAPSGGTPPYIYAWSNGTATASINNLNSGSYSCTLTDANGCTASGSVIISVSGANPTNYCASLGSQPWVDWMTRVKVNTIDKTSGKTQYSNFTTTSTDLNTGTSYTITLENGFSWQTYNEYWKVWIDFNRNGTFEEPAEIAFSGILIAPPLGAPGGVTIGSITVPTTADLGLCRMRVSLKRGAYATPCETIPFGEVEDYTINLSSGGPVPCSITSTASNIACNDNGTATISTDDTYTFSLTVNGNGTSASWQATIAGQAQTGNYGIPKLIGPLPISGGALNFTVRDATEITCTVAQSVTPPPPCSNVNPCAISATISSIACNNNGTAADPSDDTFTFNILATGSGSGTGSGWAATILGAPVTGSYGQVKQLGPYAISGGSLTFTIADAATASCTTTKTVTPPATCSGGGGGANYCASVSAFPWHDWISGVSLGTIDNPSNKTPYSDFTGLSATLQKGQGYPVALSAGFSWFTYTEHWKVWIDYDQDGLFEEPGELAFSSVQTAPPNGTLEATVNGTINIPTTAATGTTRMRVAMKRGAAPTPCETLPNGEVEDYTVNLAVGADGGDTGERALAAQLDAVPDLDAIQLYAVLETMPGASFWLLEKSADGELFTPFLDAAISEGEDYLVVEQSDPNPAEGENFYRITIFDGQGNPLRQALANAGFKSVEVFTVFPNPAANEFFVELSKAHGKTVRLEVFNRQGIAVHREVLEEVTEPFHRIPLDAWQEGMYFVFIQVEGRKALSKRLVVTKP